MLKKGRKHCDLKPSIFFGVDDKPRRFQSQRQGEKSPYQRSVFHYLFVAQVNLKMNSAHAVGWSLIFQNLGSKRKDPLDLNGTGTGIPYCLTTSIVIWHCHLALSG